MSVTRADDTPWDEWTPSLTYGGRPKNEFRFTSQDKTTIEMRLDSKTHQQRTVLFDVDKLHLARLFTWCQAVSHGCIYAQTVTADGKSLKMHTLVSGFAFTDHINRNGLDNRMQNLRSSNIVDNANNTRMQKNNTSGVNGIRDVPERTQYQVSWWQNKVARRKSFSYGARSLFTKERAFELAKKHRFEVDKITGCTNGYEVVTESADETPSKRQRLM